MLKGKNLVIVILLVLVCVLGFSNIQNSKNIDSLTEQVQASQRVRIRDKRAKDKRLIKLRAYEKQLEDVKNQNKEKDAKIKKMKKQLDECKTETRDSINTKTGKHETIKLTPAQAKEFDTTGEIASDEIDE
ncbi:hypothetical protein [Lactobacillus johnsonii]|uniref:hypothetical protein n=1 Tax=Lactobacillus johnsonii TaxID=33959 RepID=UPI00107EB27B|nr:hypothetical protein [Lactobacillus johnsonii]TGA93832.1 hypothetical protein E5F86_03450 [Lactobacillus johnsonii]